MRKLEKREDEKPNGEPSKLVTNDNADFSAVNPDQSQTVQQCELTNSSGGNKDSSAIARKSTGPRTVAGKKRSRHNAIKHGLFAADALLKNESRAKYIALVNGLLEHIQPVGMLESLCVEELALLYWRLKRCYRAEAAEIENATVLEVFDSVHALELAAWDQSRAEQPSGGLLRDNSNPFILRESIAILMTVRDSLARFGFQKGGDPFHLSKVYGLDDSRVPAGIFKLFQMWSWLATDTSEELRNVYSPDELKKQMLEAFDEEIKSLERAADFSQQLVTQSGRYQSVAALVPAHNVTDRIIRRQVQLSREIDRILSRLEKLQRSRRGQPVPPSKVP